MSRHLYIADDNAEFTHFIASVARREGWQVDTCVNGSELLRKLSVGTRPAFLIIAVNMPEVDGIEVISGLVSIDRPLRIRYITGGAGTTIRAAKLIAEANHLAVGDNLYKPLPMEALKDLLRCEAKALDALADGLS